MKLEDRYEFKIIRGEGDETMVAQTFGGGATLDGVVDLFKVFLKAVTFTDGTIQSVFAEDYQDDF